MSERSFVRRHPKKLAAGAALAGALIYGQVHGNHGSAPHDQPPASPSPKVESASPAPTFDCTGIKIARSSGKLVLTASAVGTMPPGDHLQYSVDYYNVADIRFADAPADTLNVTIPNGNIRYAEASVVAPNGHVDLCGHTSSVAG